MIKLWQDEAWKDYLYWQAQDEKNLKRINRLLQDIERNGHNGIGKPEPLRHDLSGFWSVKIDDKNRIVFRIENGKLEIWQCGSLIVISKGRTPVERLAFQR